MNREDIEMADSPQDEPQDLSSRVRHEDIPTPIKHEEMTSDEEMDSEDSSPVKRMRRLEDNNNIEGYDLSSKREFLASLELATSPDTEEEQDPFLEDFKRMKSKGEFTCRLCTLLFPNLRALKSHNRVHLDGPDFQCNLCPFTSFERSLVIRHMRTHNGERPYECSICKYAFTTKANCERHLRNRHTKEASTQMDLPIDLSVKKPQEPLYPYLSLPYFIPPPLLYQNLQKDLFRGLQLSGGRLLEKKEEVKMVIKNGVLVPKQKQRRYRTERPFGCDHCAARFTLRSNMERHVKQQHPEFWSQRQRSAGRKSREAKSESREIPKGVKEAIVEQIKLKQEEKKESGDLASVSKMLDNASNQNFREYFDREEDPGEDSEEGLVASNSEEASSEERSSPESGETKKRSAYSLAPNRVSCPYCSREFPWTSSLRRHVLTHTGQKPYKCPACPLLFTTKSNCDRHLGRKHGGNVNNNNNNVNMKEDKVEKRRKDEEKDEIELIEMPFKCHLCESSFKERQSALSHLKSSHSTEYSSLVAKGALESCSETEEADTSAKDQSNRKVVCAFCLRRFWSAEDLRRHMRTHTGERPFSCDLCSRKFTLKHSMLRHKKKHNQQQQQQQQHQQQQQQQQENNDNDDNRSDLISNLLGIKDSSLVEAMLASTANDAAKILGIDKSTT